MSNRSELMVKLELDQEPEEVMSQPRELICVFDTETSGLPQRVGNDMSSLRVWDTCRLVEICWILCDKKSKEIIKTRRAVIKPVGFVIPESASRIHGITQEQALAEGEELSLVLQEFLEDVQVCSLLVAHNIQFDDNVVRTEMVRCNLPRERYAAVPQYCTMLRSCEILERKKWPKLGVLYEELLKKPLEGAHQAENDTRACMEVFFVLQDLAITKYS